jgi:hypothetical protein
MSAWYLLWMFVTAVGIIGLGATTPILWAWSSEGPERAEMRLYAWRHVRRLRREVETYGQPLRACLYCGSECELGPNCANRDLWLKAQGHPLGRLPCPCARCGKEATWVGAFQNSAGHIFCGWTCYRAAGGET